MRNYQMQRQVQKYLRVLIQLDQKPSREFGENEPNIQKQSISIDKYSNTNKLFNNVNVKEIYVGEGYISYTLKTGWSFSQEIVKIYNLEEYLKDYDVKEKRLIQDDWYYVILNGR